MIAISCEATGERWCRHHCVTRAAPHRKLRIQTPSKCSEARTFCAAKKAAATSAFTNCPRTRGRASAKRLRLAYRTCIATSSFPSAQLEPRAPIYPVSCIIRILGVQCWRGTRYAHSFTAGFQVALGLSSRVLAMLHGEAQAQTRTGPPVRSTETHLLVKRPGLPFPTEPQQSAAPVGRGERRPRLRHVLTSQVTEFSCVYVLTNSSQALTPAGQGLISACSARGSVTSANAKSSTQPSDIDIVLSCNALVCSPTR